MWKHFISDYLNFTKRDRIGILALLSGIGFFLLLPFFYPYLIKQKVPDHAIFENEIASLKIRLSDSSVQTVGKNKGNHHDRNYDQNAALQNYDSTRKGDLFYFDPNSTSTADWKRLGLRDKTIATIQNYLSKGGKFYRKEDIGKIWGLHKEEVQRLLPFIQIRDVGFSKESKVKIYEKKINNGTIITPAMVDINTADTAAFIALPGIGSKLSQRIVNFREKLGGFYKVEQIGETYGLADSTFQKIKPFLKINTNSAVRQLNINTATIDEMKSHPYLRYALASAIVQYRAQHGNYLAVADIKRIMTVTGEIFIKLAPYLSVQ